MRPSRTVAGAALAAGLAVGALPGLAGPPETSQDRPIDAVAFRNVDLATTRDRLTARELAPDTAGRSAGALVPVEPLTDSAGVGSATGVAARPKVGATGPSWTWKQARTTMHGFASFYDHGTTAMRLPRGTVVVICGAGGCIERVITDYGPSVKGGRIVDMYRPDFFKICGCGRWSGTTEVTIRVY